jgi:ribulose-5-phosphate 4-epimerase/fuculose-1-phosphate aldolase
MTLDDRIPTAVAEALAVASRILAHKEIVDGFGHVSARDPRRPDRFLLSRSLAPALVTPADIMTLDLQGEPCGGDDRKPFLERFIHAAIYAARPDVQAVVHSHSPAVIPFGIVRGAGLRPAFHMAGFIEASTPVFEIRDVSPESDMLIRNASLGAALAASLGDGPVILMRGHGSTVVGADIPEAVYRAVYLEANARIQLDAARLGPITFLSPEEARNAAASNAGQIGRAWALWCSEVDAS